MAEYKKKKKTTTIIKVNQQQKIHECCALPLDNGEVQKTLLDRLWLQRGSVELQRQKAPQKMTAAMFSQLPVAMSEELPLYHHLTSSSKEMSQQRRQRKCFSIGTGRRRSKGGKEKPKRMEGQRSRSNNRLKYWPWFTLPLCEGHGECEKEKRILGVHH